MKLNLKPLAVNQSYRRWQAFRGPLLAILCLGVSLVALKSMLMPVQREDLFTPYVFQQEVPLSGWQLLGTSPLGDLKEQSENTYDETLAGRTYKYSRDNLPLEIEMRYVVASFGDVGSFIKSKTSIKPQQRLDKVLQQKHSDNIGYSSHFIYQERAYLSSCINPRGGSTVDGGQFMNNRSTYDLRLDRALPVLLGQESLRDRRCLWVHMSIPLKDVSTTQAFKTLDEAWASWFAWWSPRFPKH